MLDRITFQDKISSKLKYFPEVTIIVKKFNDEIIVTIDIESIIISISVVNTYGEYIVNSTNENTYNTIYDQHYQSLDDIIDDIENNVKTCITGSCIMTKSSNKR